MIHIKQVFYGEHLPVVEIDELAHLLGNSYKPLLMFALGRRDEVYNIQMVEVTYIPSTEIFKVKDVRTNIENKFSKKYANDFYFFFHSEVSMDAYYKKVVLAREWKTI